MYLNSSKLFASMVCWSLFCATQTLAQQQVGKEDLVTKMQKVQAVDADGNPIEGVSVKPFGLNTSYFWPESLMGKPVTYTTDKNGFVSLAYPELFADSVHCKSIDCMVEHLDYVGTVARIPINEADPQKVTLSKGVRFGLKAIDLDGLPIKERFGAMMSGDSTPIFRQVGTEGLLETKGASLGPHQVMLVQPMADNKTRFSEALFVNFKDRDQEVGVVLDDVELQPGVRVFGKLPSNIQRPIKDGVVLARQQPLPITDARELGMRQLMWGAWTTIAEDGSFEFSSMPRSGKIQVIAMCDGWVALDEGRMTKGQTFSVSDEDLEVELELQPTMDAIINVKDEAGNPIQDASVGFWPNQLWEDFGSQILGERWRSVDQVKAQVAQDEASVTFDRVNAFLEKTDAKGRAIIRNLPIRSEHQFVVEKRGFSSPEQTLPLPAIPEERQAKTAERLTSEMTVTLKKSETP